MLTIVGLVVVAAGILAAVFAWRTAMGAYLAAVLVVVGTGLQVYEAWARLPDRCRSLTGAMSCMMPTYGALNHTSCLMCPSLPMMYETMSSVRSPLAW